jgi:energy-coupling factor transporter ATP-binding protein EcfA2
VVVNPVISVANLSYRYPDGKEALSDVTFRIGTGECLGLIGPNGSGKSTLLMHLNGILPDPPAETPNVSVFGLPVVGTNLCEVRRRVGLLFQDSDDQLFCPTVFEDVAFGPEQLGECPEEVRRRVTESLTRVGLAGFESRSPQHLSGGEKQRVGLAGILACRSEILALDEPTSELDPRGERALIDLLRSLPVTKLIATHDLELVVKLCSRVILLDGGRIIADGPMADILGDEALMLEHGLEKPHILQHPHPHDAARNEDRA